MGKMRVVQEMATKKNESGRVATGVVLLVVGILLMAAMPFLVMAVVFLLGAQATSRSSSSNASMLTMFMVGFLVLVAVGTVVSLIFGVKMMLQTKKQQGSLNAAGWKGANKASSQENVAASDKLDAKAALKAFWKMLAVCLVLGLIEVAVYFSDILVYLLINVSSVGNLSATLFSVRLVLMAVGVIVGVLMIRRWLQAQRAGVEIALGWKVLAALGIGACFCQRGILCDRFRCGLDAVLNRA